MSNDQREEALRLAKEAEFDIKVPDQWAKHQWESYVAFDGCCTNEVIKLIALARSSAAPQEPVAHDVDWPKIKAADIHIFENALTAWENDDFQGTLDGLNEAIAYFITPSAAYATPQPQAATQAPSATSDDVRDRSHEWKEDLREMTKGVYAWKDRAEKAESALANARDKAQTADARDAARFDWFLLDCDFDVINGFDVREMAYEALPHSATESEYNAAYLAACRKAIDAAIDAIQGEEDSK